MERKRLWVDFREDSIALMEGDEELVMWTEDEWIENLEVVFPICNAIILGATKDAKKIRRRLELSDDSEEEKEEETICPLCNESMDYKSLKRANGNMTHLWVCSRCPNIMFEFYDSGDLNTLQEYLIRG